MVNGRTQAVLNQEHSFSHLPRMSIPTAVYAGTLKRLTEIRIIQSGSRLSHIKYNPNKRRYANGAICTARVIFRIILTSLPAASALWSRLSIGESL